MHEEAAAGTNQLVGPLGNCGTRGMLRCKVRCSGTRGMLRCKVRCSGIRGMLRCKVRRCCCKIRKKACEVLR